MPRIWIAALLLATALLAVPAAGSGGSPVYEYGFSGYAVVYRGIDFPVPLHYYVEVEGVIPLAPRASGRFVNGTRFEVELAAVCGAGGQEPYYTSSIVHGSRGLYRLFRVYVPAECSPVRVDMVWWVEGLVRVFDLNSSHAEVVVEMNLSLVSVPSRVGGDFRVEYLGLPRGAEEFSLTYRFLVDKSRNLLYLNGTLLGFNNLYIYYPRSLDEYLEWRGGGGPAYTYLGYSVDIYLDNETRPSYICARIPSSYAEQFYRAYRAFASEDLVLNVTVPWPRRLASISDPNRALLRLLAWLSETGTGGELLAKLRGLVEELATSDTSKTVAHRLYMLRYPWLDKPHPVLPGVRKLYTNLACYRDHYPLYTGDGDLGFNLLLPLPRNAAPGIEAGLLHVAVGGVNHSSVPPHLAVYKYPMPRAEPPPAEILLLALAVILGAVFIWRRLEARRGNL